jgi:hypothetical protein
MAEFINLAFSMLVFTFLELANKDKLEVSNEELGVGKLPT